MPRQIKEEKKEKKHDMVCQIWCGGEILRNFLTRSLMHVSFTFSFSFTFTFTYFYKADHTEKNREIVLNVITFFFLL
jgi:hypothetical protein